MRRLYKFLPYIAIAVITGAIAIANYVPGTWLTGWDNLHPEFDFPMNIRRSVFAVWQEYQGLGLLGGMGHASDLPRQVFLYLVSTVLPSSSIRYFYHFLMLFAGVFGVYKLLSEIVLEDKEERLRKAVSFLGSLFYLLNLGTIQYFYVPFEPYSTFWGMFPWQIYALLRYLKKPDRSNLLILAIIALISVPQAYVQTIFLVYLVNIFLILSVSFFKYRSSFALKSYAKILLVIFSVNAFWLLPNLYFVKNKFNVTRDSMNNRMNTEKFYQQNKKRGTVGDFVMLKEFYYDFLDYKKDTNELTYLMSGWRDTWEKTEIKLFSSIVFVFIIYGLARKSRLRNYLVIIFSTSAFIFLSDVPVISSANDLLRNVPVVNQIFRNPFTKFIVPTIFIFSVAFSLGFAHFLEILKGKNGKFLRIFFFTFFFAGIVYSSYPVFSGKLIYDRMKLQIPKEYFDLFSYFSRTGKNTRIANFPQDSYWGWGSYRWGTIGSGFIWYGIEQPIMDRAFDVWSSDLEAYYWQLMSAIRKNDSKLFDSVMEKHDISYIIFDPSYIPSDSSPVKTLLEQEKLITDSGNFVLDASFGKIKVYKKLKPVDFAEVIFRPESTFAASKYFYTDELFNNHGNYYLSQTGNIAYPFSGVFSGRFQDEGSVSITETELNFRMSTEISKGKYSMTVPFLTKEEVYIPVEVYGRKNNGGIELKFLVNWPKIILGDREIYSERREKTLQLDNLEGDLLLSMNNRDYLETGYLDANLKYIGSTYLLNNSMPNYFRVFSKENSANFKMEPKNFNPAKECMKGSPGSKVKSNVTDNVLDITAEKTSACVTYSRPVSGIDQSLIELMLDYRSEGDELPSFCFWNALENSCMNRKANVNSGYSSQWRKISEKFENFNNYSDSWLDLILDANNQNEDAKRISYRNIYLISYPLVSTFSINISELISSKTAVVQFDAVKDSSLDIVIPKYISMFNKTGLISRNIFQFGNITSNLMDKGDVNIDLSEENSVRMYSKNNYLNFWLDINDWDNSGGSILSIKSKNISGFPLILNASTMKKSNKLIYTYIGEGSSYFIVPPVETFDSGLKVILHNNSVNRMPTVNEISDVSVYRFPFNYLKGVKLEKDISSPSEKKQTNFDVIAHPNTGYYKLILDMEHGKENAGDNRFLVLSQSFDKGWKAYRIRNHESGIMKTLEDIFPFLFGQELDDHVIINSWKNGWRLQDSDKEEDVAIVIIYLPQYIQYIGFAMLLLMLLVIPPDLSVLKRKFG